MTAVNSNMNRTNTGAAPYRQFMQTCCACSFSGTTERNSIRSTNKRTSRFSGAFLSLYSVKKGSHCESAFAHS